MAEAGSAAIIPPAALTVAAAAVLLAMPRKDGMASVAARDMDRLGTLLDDSCAGGVIERPWDSMSTAWPLPRLSRGGPGSPFM